MAKKPDFDNLVDSLCEMGDVDAMLESCHKVDTAAIQSIPLRYRIIAMGFAARLSHEEVQRKLTENGCPRLYSRSAFEATLIYAFHKRLTYDQWREIRARYTDILENAPADPYFGGSRITFSELERYLTDNSETNGSMLATQMRTRMLDDLLTGEDDLSAFFRLNAMQLSAVRETTRYYFAKYLYYYLIRQTELYFGACVKDPDGALSYLAAFKAVTAIRRHKTMTAEEKQALLHDAAISCGAVFDEFNHYFFDYVSRSWMDILAELYPTAQEMPKGIRKALADTYRRRNKALKRLSDEDAITQGMAEDDAAGYGDSRAGEHALTDYIKGTRDIGRTVLCFFLMFFSANGKAPKEQALTTDKLQTILHNCGYPPLDPEESDLDWFIVEFFDSRDPSRLVKAIVEESAVRSHENSFLYHLYRGGVSNSREIKEILS